MVAVKELLSARYDAATSAVPAASVPVSVTILTRNEEANIERCLASVAWARQVVVIDSGSTDRTVEIARSCGATVVETHWRGFGPQREFAMRLTELQYQWVYSVDADEWVSEDLAAEVAEIMTAPAHPAYWQYFRLVFQGRWISHCGWYPSQRIVRLMDVTRCGFGAEGFSEHPEVAGALGRIHSDIVDEDLKGLAAWLHKHVDYARLEALRRQRSGSPDRLPHESRLRHLLKDHVAPRIPARPLATFVWMYVVRAGFLDGREGLLFCFYHAWFQATVQALAVEGTRKDPAMPASTQEGSS